MMLAISTIRVLSLQQNCSLRAHVSSLESPHFAIPSPIDEFDRLSILRATNSLMKELNNTGYLFNLKSVVRELIFYLNSFVQEKIFFNR